MDLVGGSREVPREMGQGGEEGRGRSRAQPGVPDPAVGVEHGQAGWVMPDRWGMVGS